MNGQGDTGTARRTAVMLWFACVGGVVVVTALGVALAGAELVARASLDVAAFVVGVLATATSVAAPVLMRVRFLRSVADGRSGVAGATDVATLSKTAASVLRSATIVMLACAEVPALTAFVFAFVQGGYSLAGTIMVALSAILLGLAFPKRSEWELYVRQVEAARAGASAAPVQ